MRRLASLGLFIALLTLSGCFGPGLPQWVETASSPQYPEGQYLTGVGMASKALGLKSAESKARAHLSSQVAVSLKSEIQDVMRSTSSTTASGTRSTGFQSVAQKIVEKTEIELEGVEIVERINADGAIYVLVALNRADTRRNVWPKAEEAAKAANDLIQRAKDKQAAGDLPGAMAAYRQAIAQVAKLEHLKAQLKVVARTLYDGVDAEMSASQLALAAADIADRMRFAIVAYSVNEHEINHLPSLEAHIVQGLQAEGYTAAAVDGAVRNVGPDGLLNDLDATQRRLGGQAAFLLVAEAEAMLDAVSRIAGRTAYRYRGKGNATLVDLTTRKVIGAVEVPANKKTTTVQVSQRVAAAKSAQLVVEPLARKTLARMLEMLSGR